MTHKLTISVLGTTVLDVQLGRTEPPPAAPAKAEAADEVGPVTETRNTCTLGFAPQQEYVRHADRNNPGVIR